MSRKKKKPRDISIKKCLEVRVIKQTQIIRFPTNPSQLNPEIGEFSVVWKSRSTDFIALKLCKIGSVGLIASFFSSPLCVVVAIKQKLEEQKIGRLQLPLTSLAMRAWLAL